MWNLKYHTDKLIQKTETDSEIQDKKTNKKNPKNLKFPKGKKWGKGINQEFGMIQTITYKIDKQQSSTVWHMELYSVSCNKL